MQLFRNRPLSLSCMGFLATAFLCYFLNAELCFWISLALFSLMLLFFVLWQLLKRRALLLVFLCLLLSLAAALSSTFLFHVPREKYESLVEGEVVIEGRVLSVRTTSYGGEELELLLEDLDGERCHDRVYLRASAPLKCEIGDVLRATAVCEEFSSSPTYDARAAALSDGVFGTFTLKSGTECERIEAERFSLRTELLRWRALLSKRLASLVEGEEGALCVAFFLGDRSLLSDDISLQFRRVGISHLLALSGLHVSILIAFLEIVLKRLGCPRTLRVIAVIFLSIFYLFLTGCALSTVRAVLMCNVLMASFLFRANYDSFTALCTALVLILIFSPYALTDLGMWMSFLAAASIIVFQPIAACLRERLSGVQILGLSVGKVLVACIGAIFVGLVANLALAPIQGFVFGELPLLSIPATLLLSLPLNATLILSPATLVLPFFAGACRAVTGGILWCAETFSATKGILLPLGDAVSYTLLLLLAISLIAIAVLHLKQPLRWFLVPTLLGLLLIPCSLLVTHLAHDRVDVTYVSSEVGRGEAMVIARAGECAVVDLSGKPIGAVYEIADAAKEARCTEIDELILSCYAETDADLLDRLSARVLIRRLCLPNPQNEWEETLAGEIEAMALLHNIPVSYRIDFSWLAEITDLQMLEERPKELSDPPILFSFICHGTRLTYANGAFAAQGTGGVRYRALFDGTHVMIHGGTRYGKGRFISSFPSLHTLILAEKVHREGFSFQLLGRDVLAESRKYVFE